MAALQEVLVPFRYATRTELVLNTLGLVGCIAAGAVQPLMNIPFGSVSTVNAQMIVLTLHRSRQTSSTLLMPAKQTSIVQMITS